MSDSDMRSVDNSTSIEFNKNGTVSRKRLHLGNLPSIPRTEECPVCSAKFTRLNHLKRHLLTHTDSRKHECEQCHFQFTRRDLLTKHKRICGKPKVRTYKSRRKSCLPCAVAKCKCDLQQPCSYCKSRNKDCVFPGESSSDTCTVTHTQDWDVYETNEATLFQAPHPQVDESQAQLTDSLVPFAQSLTPLRYSGHSPHELISFSQSNGNPSGVSISPSLRNNFSELRELYGASISSHGTPSHSFASVSMPTAYLPLKTPFPQLDGIEPSGDIPGSQLQNYVSPFVSGNSYMEHCLSLCFQRFSVNIPLIHIGSWGTDGKSPILISVMQACGATFLNTPEARSFVRFVADSVPDMLFVELNQCPADLSTELQLVCAYLFLQSEAIFNMQSWKLESTHDAVMRMICRNKLTDEVAAWKMPAIYLKPSFIDEIWRKWSEYETSKRVLWLFYVYDVLSVVYFGAKPEGDIPIFNVPLPSETDLWVSRTSMEWFWIIGGDPKYWHFEDTFMGLSVFTVLTSMRQCTAAPAYNPWHLSASIVVVLLEIHRALVARREAKTEFFSQFYDHSKCVPTRIRLLGEYLDFSDIRLMLHNWLEGWKQCPDIFDGDGRRPKQEVCFHNLIHLYYTAHVLLDSFEKPSSEFTWDGCGIAWTTKLWVTKEVPSEDRNTIISWEELSSMRFSNQNDADTNPFLNIYDNQLISPGLAIYC